MTEFSRRLARAGWVLSLGSIPLAGLGCEGRPAEERSQVAEVAESPRRVALPALDAYPQSVREQLRSQREHLRTLENHENPDPARLGEAYGIMGRLLFAYDLDHAAQPALLNAIELLPDDARWQYYLGHLYESDARLERAAQHFERALALQPEDVPTHIHLARIYRDSGRDAEAKKLLHEAIRIDPESAVAYLLLGHIAGSDEPSKAISYYETVLRLQPSSSVVHYPLAIVYQRRGDADRSREHLAQRGDTDVELRDPLLEELDRIRTGPGAKIYQGNRLKTDGRYREAAALFEEAAAEDTANVTAYLNLANAVAQLGDIPKAIDALGHVLRLDPENSAAHYNIGYLFGLQGEEEKGLEHYRAAVEADPTNDVARLALANTLWRKRQCDEAIVHFEQFLVSNPEHLEARMSGAVCHAQLGQYVETRKLLETGYEAFPQHLILQDAMVRVLAASPDARVRDGVRALEMAERLTATFQRPETLESLAMAYAELGRFSDAVQYQREVIRAAEGQVPKALMEYLQNNLQRYEQGLPSRTPWPPTVFDR